MRTEIGGALTLAERISALRRTLLRSLTRQLSGRSSRPLPQLLALRLVSRCEVRTQAELADRLGIDAPAASRLVDKLEDDGLLCRQPGPNRRCVLLQITPMATRSIQELEIGLAALGDQVRTTLSDEEIEQTLKLLEKLLDGLALDEAKGRFG